MALADSQSTRSRILDAAEQLFARHGFAATSLRTITAAADANLAAVNYHFGSKERLIAAVFARRFEPLNQERLRRLDGLERAAGDAPVELERIAAAFVQPAASLARSSNGGVEVLMQLFGRLHTEPNEQIRELIFEQFGEVLRRYMAAFGRALPELETDEIFCRLHFAVGALSHTLLDPHRLRFASADAPAQESLERVIERLVAFVVAGFRAPATGCNGDLGDPSRPESPVTESPVTESPVTESR